MQYRFCAVTTPYSNMTPRSPYNPWPKQHPPFYPVFFLAQYPDTQLALASSAIASMNASSHEVCGVGADAWPTQCSALIALHILQKGTKVLPAHCIPPPCWSLWNLNWGLEERLPILLSTFLSSIWLASCLNLGEIM